MGYAMAYACWARNTGHDWRGCTWFIHFDDMQWVRAQRSALSAGDSQ